MPSPRPSPRGRGGSLTAGVELAVGLRVEHYAADVVAGLVGGMRLEDFVVFAAGILPHDAGHARGAAVVGGEREDGFPAKAIEELPEIRRAQARVDAGVVEERRAG